MFLRTARDCGVDVVQANFEADAYMARLAGERRCPVVSNDSDFFVYPVDFVFLDSLRCGTTL